MSATLPADSRPEYGRHFGRRNEDSSSSRESSPTRGKPKRSFTPTSDDEAVIQPIADAETPPPDRPLIRASLAFSGAPSTVDTYQASTVPKPPHQTLFLPGQEVPIPPPPPKVPKTRKKRESRLPSSQTGRFRVVQYDPTPVAAPALTSGTGPYSSIYRASSLIPNAGESANDPPQDEVATRSKRVKPSNPAKASTLKSKATKAKSSAAKSQPSPKPTQGSSSALPNMALQSGPVPIASSSSYPPEFEQNIHQASPSRFVEDPVLEASLPEDPPRSLPPKRPKAPLRLVTILIEDVRGEVHDSQLAEVRVALRDSEDTAHDGYWANAEDICQTLQSSASRIDGPAKVYAWRGKYRQVILRVSADNQDDWVNANVVVKPDRTLEVIVESGLPLGATSAARGMTPAAYMTPARPTGEHLELGSRKRRHSPTDDYGERSRSSRQWSPSTMASSPGLSTSTRKSRSYEPRADFLGRAGLSSERHHSHYPTTHYLDAPYEHRDSSESDSSEPDDPDAMHKRVVDEINPLISAEENWEEYYQATAKPRTAPAVLKEYRIFNTFVEKWEGKRAPSGALIERSHIVAALQPLEHNKEEREKYVSRCAETLRLMALYGPEGRRMQDPEVSKLIQDDTIPGYGQNPARALLHVLRDLDKHWAANNA